MYYFLWQKQLWNLDMMSDGVQFDMTSLFSCGGVMSSLTFIPDAERERG